jgi:formylglycine-generating enzyme required for sulfatase activity
MVDSIEELKYFEFKSYFRQGTSGSLRHHYCPLDLCRVCGNKSMGWIWGFDYGHGEIKAFLLAKYPVTIGLYDLITHRISDTNKMDATPMVNVSWYDAVSFCNLLSKECGLNECYSFEKIDSKVFCDWNANGYRLPTDAEWQYASKAGTTGYRYGEMNEIAWYYDNSGGAAHAVGKKKPNYWGLYDMLGNIWEWCWDLYDEKTYGTYRIFRGGSWAEEARGCGSTCRRRSHPTFRIDDLGFRIAKSY